MNLIVWTNVLSVGIEEIDEQHKQLISIINQLNDAIRDKRGRNVFKNALTELNHYVVYHFTFEETLFDDLAYDEKESHLKKHALFIEELNTLTHEFDDLEQDISEKLVTFLRQWLINHILSVDKKLGHAIMDKY